VGQHTVARQKINKTNLKKNIYYRFIMSYGMYLLQAVLRVSIFANADVNPESRSELDLDQ
jgi:hypothetical protein